jgi:Carbohydrate esterase, sialic acid-specific acetylesterase
VAADFRSEGAALRQKALCGQSLLFADDGRLIADETKTAVACPKQSDKTAVLLALGQSNAANHGGQRYRSEYGAHVVNFFGGRCFIAASPLLGSTDARGEYWTKLGNLLIASGKFDNVVIAPLAFSGSEVARWARGGDINGLMVETARQLERQGYRVTDVLWDQGEVDYVKGTSEAAYRERFLSMVDTLHGQNIKAPVYLSIASKCLEPSNNGFKTDAADNAIVRAQLALSKSGNGLRQGVNTDALLDEVDRYDDCHIAGTGAEKVSRAWADLLLADRKTTLSHRAESQ